MGGIGPEDALPAQSLCKGCDFVKNAEAWMGFIILLFSGTIFYQTFSLDYFAEFTPGPGLFPRWLSATLFAVTAIYIASTFRHKYVIITQILPCGSALRKVVSVFVALLLFLVLVSYIGYVIAGVMMMMILFYGEYKWYAALFISSVTTLVIFILFYSVLSVPLPLNVFGF